MRIHLHYVSSLLLALFIVTSLGISSAQANMCRKYLSPSTTATTSSVNKDVESKKETRPTTSFAKNIESTEVIPTVERIIDIAVEAKLLTKPEARHLRHDLEELKTERNFKEDHPTFKDMLGQWSTFISGIEGKIQEYKQLTPQEQKQWKGKMELPIYFATAHFIVFLETKNNKNFDFSRMTTLLKVSRDEALNGDIKLYLYAFEKQVRRYFSTKEFRRCRA